MENHIFLLHLEEESKKESIGRQSKKDGIGLFLGSFGAT